jgi:hypothetical protein
MKRYIEICGLMLALSCTGYTQDRSCPTSLPILRTWDALYKSYQSYRQCDDGAVGEGYSESVARILVDRWNTLPRLSSLARENSGFLRFVLKHVDATLDTKDVRKIRVKAITQCPGHLSALCNDLKKQAETALKDNATSR